MMRVIACNAMALFITGYEMDNNTFALWSGICYTDIW